MDSGKVNLKLALVLGPALGAFLAVALLAGWQDVPMFAWVYWIALGIVPAYFIATTRSAPFRTGAIIGGLYLLTDYVVIAAGGNSVKQGLLDPAMWPNSQVRPPVIMWSLGFILLYGLLLGLWCWLVCKLAFRITKIKPEQLQPEA